MKELDQINCHSLPKSYIPKDLKSCDNVWLRIDRVRKPLEAPYSGPYKVIERFPKYFKIELSNDVHNNVSIDRLKPVVEPKLSSDSVQTNSESDVNVENSDTNNDVHSEDNDSDVVSLDVTNSESTEVPKTTSSGRRISFKKDNEYFYY